MKYNQLLFKPICSNGTSNRQQFCPSSNNSLTFNTHKNKIHQIKYVSGGYEAKALSPQINLISIFHIGQNSGISELPRHSPGDTTMPQKEISLSYTDCYKSYAYPRKIQFRTKLKLYANKSYITWKINEIYFNRNENSAEFNATKRMTTSKNSPSNSQKLRYNFHSRKPNDQLSSQ